VYASAAGAVGAARLPATAAAAAGRPPPRTCRAPRPAVQLRSPPVRAGAARYAGARWTRALAGRAAAWRAHPTGGWQLPRALSWSCAHARADRAALGLARTCQARHLCLQSRRPGPAPAGRMCSARPAPAVHPSVNFRQWWGCQQASRARRGLLERHQRCAPAPSQGGQRAAATAPHAHRRAPSAAAPPVAAQQGFPEVSRPGRPAGKAPGHRRWAHPRSCAAALERCRTSVAVLERAAALQALPHWRPCGVPRSQAGRRRAGTPQACWQRRRPRAPSCMRRHVPRPHLERSRRLSAPSRPGQPLGSLQKRGERVRAMGVYAAGVCQARSLQACMPPERPPGSQSSH